MVSANDSKKHILDLLRERSELEKQNPKLVESLNDFRETFAQFRKVQDQYNGKRLSIPDNKRSAKYQA